MRQSSYISIILLKKPSPQAGAFPYLAWRGHKVSGTMPLTLPHKIHSVTTFATEVKICQIMLASPKGTSQRCSSANAEYRNRNGTPCALADPHMNVHTRLQESELGQDLSV